MMNNIKGIQKSLEHTYEWVKIFMQDYSFSNENKAFVVLRATLKALRDRLPLNEVVHLGSQLPVVLRGFYYEGWNPSLEVNKIKNEIEFINLVRFHLNGHDDIDLDEAVPVAIKLIFDMIDQGEAEEVKANFPAELKDYFSKYQ
jgi:uncharacterized protein (DUF2267 family)